jgi:hypothetical protein
VLLDFSETYSFRFRMNGSSSAYLLDTKLGIHWMWPMLPAAVTARKDGGPAAVQAAIDHVAGSSSL